MKMKQSVITILVGILVFCFLAVPQVFYIVDETDQAIVTQFGKFKRAIREPGLYMKIPMVQIVQHFDKRILVSDASPAEYLTGDKKRVVVDHIIRWQIVDPLKFFKSVNNESAARARLDDIVVSELRKGLASHDFTDVVTKERDGITAEVTKGAAKQARQFGIEIRDVRLKRVDLPREVQESVFSRMVAERERIAKRYRSEGEEEAAKIRAETDKEKSILLAEAYQVAQKLRGEGDAEGARIYAEAFGKDAEFYNFVRSLAVYEKGFTEESILVLTGREKFLRYLSSPDGKSSQP